MRLSKDSLRREPSHECSPRLQPPGDAGATTPGNSQTWPQRASRALPSAFRLLALAAFCLLPSAFLLAAALGPRPAHASPPALAPAPRWPQGTASPTETPPPACGLAWRVGSTSNTGTGDNVLNGVAAVSPDDVWAVGYYSIGTMAQTLIMRWDGANWNVVPSPNRGSSTNLLSAVLAISPNNVWAVGWYFNGPETDTLTMHWDGAQWTVVDSPNIGSVGNFLNALSAPPGSPGNDIWAVGQSYNGSSFLPLIEHWDGTRWSIVPSPNPGPNDNRLRGVAAISANNAWAVGYYYAGDDYLTLTLHWDGASWSEVTSPNVGPGANYLRAISALSSGDVWAIGNYSPGGIGPFQTITMHWDGSRWALVPSPSPSLGNNYLRGVRALSANDAWAVGYYDNESGTGMKTLTLRWDGARWSIVSSPNPGALNQLYSVSATSPNDAWAVGIWETTGNYQTLVERYQDPCASPTATATPTHTQTHTSTPTPTNTPPATSTSTTTPTSTASPIPSSTATSIPTSCVITFTDVHPDDYFYTPVHYLYCHGAISGYADGTFKPYNLTTRGQLAKIVALAEGWPTYTPPTPTFQDVPSTNPFYTFIETAYHQGIISGYSCGPTCLEFRPGNNVTRAQLCKIIVLAEGWPTYIPPTPTFQDVPSTDPFYVRIETAYYHAIISGYSCGPSCLEFRPGNNAIRGQICKIVYLAVTGVIEVQSALNICYS